MSGLEKAIHQYLKKTFYLFYYFTIPITYYTYFTILPILIYEN